MVTGRDVAAASKSLRQKVGRMSTPEGAEQKQRTLFFCNGANMFLNTPFWGFKLSELIDTYVL